jgi:N-acetylglucosamine kinase-like BadF-type ATPase
MFSETDQYYIAVDGGASKTELCVYNPVTKFEKHFFSGCSNYKNPKTDAEKAIINDGLEQIFRDTGILPAQIKGLVLGLAGYDSQEDYDFFMRIALLSGIPREKIYICNDCELNFFSAGKPPGISVIAGTGSIVTGIASDFAKARSGGWGSSISDEGSGGWIGISVIKDLLRYCDGYGGYRHIFDIIREYFGGAGFDALPGILSQSNVTEMAELAKLVMDESDNGDLYCTDLTSKAAGLVAEIAYSVYQKLNFIGERSVDVVMSGSLFKTLFFCETFKDNLKAMAQNNNFNFCSGVSSPVMGGIELAHTLFP